MEVKYLYTTFSYIKKRVEKMTLVTVQTIYSAYLIFTALAHCLVCDSIPSLLPITAARSYRLYDSSWSALLIILLHSFLLIFLYPFLLLPLLLLLLLIPLLPLLVLLLLLLPLLLYYFVSSDVKINIIKITYTYTYSLSLSLSLYYNVIATLFFVKVCCYCFPLP